MTKIDLQRVLDLDGEATEGPWDLEPAVNTPNGWSLGVVRSSATGEGIAYDIYDSDGELLAVYRTAAPAMARALNAVLGAIEVLREDNPREAVLLNALGILEGFIERHIGDQTGSAP